MKNSNPVIQIYKGIEIRKSQVVGIRFSDIQMIAFIDEAQRTGLSVAEVVRVAGRPCSYCKGMEVVTQNSSGDFVHVKKNVLHNYHKNQSSGATIFNQKKKPNAATK